ncbi:hypothetical protein CRYUN_Cryun11dG0069700 [Craigia yunnanensis]
MDFVSGEKLGGIASLVLPFPVMPRVLPTPIFSFSMKIELGDLRRRLQLLESQSQIVEDVNEEVVENESDNESKGGGFNVRLVIGAANHNNMEMVEFAARNSRNADVM